jgi:hypothetical protein
MNSKEFCEQVLKQVRHATMVEKQSIRQELLNHIEDHVDALKEAGYSQDEAGDCALSAMGNPEEIGRDLNKQYPLGWLVLSRAALILINLVSHETEITVDIDLSSKTAVATFTRTNLTPPEGFVTWDGEQIPPPEDQMKIYELLSKNSSGKMRFNTVITDDPYHEFVLRDPVWESEPYLISNSAYPVAPIRINDKEHYGWISVPGGKIYYASDKNGIASSSSNYKDAHFSGEEYIPSVEDKFVFAEDSFSFANTAASFYTTTPDNEAGPGLVYRGANGYQLSPKYSLG